MDLFPTAYPTAQASAVACVFAQVSLWCLFAKVLPDGPWRKEPGFTAHQCIALPLMIYVTSLGLAEWFYPTEAPPTTALGRVGAKTVMGDHLSQVMFGAMACWDIPTGLLVDSLRKPPMVIHHVLMAWMTYLALSPAFSYYTIMFFGAIELSSVPLAVVDLVHPEHKEWSALVKRVPLLASLNTACRAVFVLLYLVVRTTWFPYVMVFHLHADLWECYAMASPPISHRALVIVYVCTSLLTLLQVFWTVLILQQARKLFGPGKKSRKAE